MADNTCACCGAIIPEGRHICLLCEGENEVQHFHPQIDSARILRLCNEIEMIMCEIYNTGHTMQNCDYEAVDKRLKSIAEEISTQPKSNADRIRAMSDSELANMLSSIWICHHFDSCEKCPLAEAENCRADGVKRWLESEVSKP